MKALLSFLIGLIGGFIGFVVWVVFSVAQAGETLTTGSEDPGITAGMAVGFALMLGLPLVFWVVVPAYFAGRTLWRWRRKSRGVALVLQGQLEAAVTEFDKAITLDPNYASAYANRGVAYAQLQDFERAAADFEKALSLATDPDFKADIQEALRQVRAGRYPHARAP